MIAKVICHKCGEDGKFDVGPDITTVEAAQAKIDSSSIQSCPFGNHIELSDIRYTVTEMIEGEAPTDEFVIAEMQAKGYLTWEGTANTPTGIEVTSFSGGFPIASCGGKPDFWMDFRSLPSGKRLYYCRQDDYDDRMKAAGAEG